MHFRLRKNVIQLIRITYDDSQKKGRNAIIGTVKLANPVISDELREKLTKEEIDAFAAWLNTQHRTELLREELAALTLAENITLAEKWFERAQNPAAAQLAAQAIVSQWHGLRRTLSQQGLLE